MLLFFLYHTFVKLSSSEDSSSEECIDIVSYASKVLGILPYPETTKLDQDLAIKFILDDWLVSRTYDLDKLCKENDCDLSIILDMLEKRSYIRLGKLEYGKLLDYSKMTDTELELHLKNYIDLISFLETRFENKYGNTDVLYLIKKEIYDIFVWNVSKMDAFTTNLDEIIAKSSSLCDPLCLDRYTEKLSTLGEYANLLTIRIIRKNMDYIKSRKFYFKDLRLPVENSN